MLKIFTMSVFLHAKGLYNNQSSTIKSSTMWQHRLSQPSFKPATPSFRLSAGWPTNHSDLVRYPVSEREYSADNRVRSPATHNTKLRDHSILTTTTSYNYPQIRWINYQTPQVSMSGLIVFPFNFDCN